MSDQARDLDAPGRLYRDLAAWLVDEGQVSELGALTLDFCGKALGVGHRERRALVQDPSEAVPDADDLLARIEGALAGCPDELRDDALDLAALALGRERGVVGAAPMCPVCKSRRPAGVRALWSPPAGTGLGPIEGGRLSLWSCDECRTVFESLDRTDPSRRSRSLRIRVAGPEVRRVVRSLERAGADPERVVQALAGGPCEPWLLERAWGAPELVEAALGAARAALRVAPDRAPELYRQPHGLARLGPPRDPAVWEALLGSELPPGLLARLARAPGAPPEVRRRLAEHPDPEIRHQALLAVDAPSELLAAALDSGETAAVLSVLDRADGGPVTLARAIEVADPHVLYRAGRHGSLDLLMLARIWRRRRAGHPTPLAPSRVLHVYAPGRPPGGASLAGAVRAEVTRAMEALGRPPQPGSPAGPARLEPDGGVVLEMARVSLSRVLLFLPVDAPGEASSLDFERAVDRLKVALADELADEVVELQVDERSGTWAAEVRQAGAPPQTTGGSGLAPPVDGADPGRWLELELFTSERALAYPGFPASLPTPRLVTRPPYVAAPREADRREVLAFGPPAESA